VWTLILPVIHVSQKPQPAIEMDNNLLWNNGAFTAGSKQMRAVNEFIGVT